MRTLFLLLIICSPCTAAKVVYESANFTIISESFDDTTEAQRFAGQASNAAETYRKDLANSWLGYELKEWSQPCPIFIKLGNIATGGASTFTFVDGVPQDWRMKIEGTPERALDSALPHEIMHLILATHVGQRIPRWADEGAATNVEHAIERARYQGLLFTFLKTGRGVPFNAMFAMIEYPRDMLPMYSQGYSLTRFLVGAGGKRRYIAYITDGTKTGNWTKATQAYYQIDSLSSLQTTWNQWVINGSPNEQMVGLPPVQDCWQMAPQGRSTLTRTAPPLQALPPRQPVQNYVSIDYSKLAIQLAKSEGFRESITCPAGPPGPPGPMGLDGLPGPPGAPGASGDCDELRAELDALKKQIATLSQGQVDVDTLVCEVQKRLLPLRIQTLRPDGSVHQDVNARLGDLVKLKAIVVSGDE